MEVINAMGRRKRAIARLYAAKGKGNITINKRDYKEFFPIMELQTKVNQPFVITGQEKKFDINVNVRGGGINGQAEAVRLAISRALCKYDPELRKLLREERLLTRDSRVVERKKPGQPKARKKFQFSKR